MLCLKILVIFIIVKCHCQIIQFKKELHIEHHGLPAKILKYIHDHWPMIKIETRAGIQKRDLQGDVPFKVELPAPVVEHVVEKKMETVLYGFQKPEPAAPGLNTNIQFSVDSTEIPGPVPIKAEEMFGGLPPLPVYAHIMVPSEVPPPSPEVPVQVPIQVPVQVPVLVEPPPPPPPVEPVPPPAEPVPPDTVRTKVRKVAVYAGDVILKYLSQFFNRARVTFNRFTSPPPPTPEFEK